MAAQSLSTVEEVVAALGGNGPIGEITGRKTQHVSNWKADGKFPADTFLVLQAALKKKRLQAPPSLWGIREPEPAQ